MFVATSPFLSAFLESDIFGKFIFLALFALSIISWSLLLYKIYIYYKIQKTIPDFEKLFLEKQSAPLNLNFEQIQNLPFHPYLNLYKELNQKTVEILNKNRFFSDNNSEVYLSPTDIELIESSLFYTLSTQSSFLDKNLFLLSTIVSLAPFLGLLGTVWGILLTFSSLNSHSLSNVNSTVLSGLAMALTTTVIGLVVAIPALIGYNYLKNSTKNLTKKMEGFSKLLLNTIEIQYRKVD